MSRSATAALFDGQPPADMPVWARLQLIRQELPFAHVDCWRYEDDRRISIFTIFGGFNVAVRPEA